MASDLSDRPLEDQLFTYSVPMPKVLSSPLPRERAPVIVGMHIDDFIFYSTDPAEEERFQCELEKRMAVNFMDNVDRFLGMAFTWPWHSNGNISVHLCQ